jgi:hypothetical protein
MAKMAPAASMKETTGCELSVGVDVIKDTKPKNTENEARTKQSVAKLPILQAASLVISDDGVLVPIKLLELFTWTAYVPPQSIKIRAIWL